jgi:hypothetical protein
VLGDRRAYARKKQAGAGEAAPASMNSHSLSLRETLRENDITPAKRLQPAANRVLFSYLTLK